MCYVHCTAVLLSIIYISKRHQYIVCSQHFALFIESMLLLICSFIAVARTQPSRALCSSGARSLGPNTTVYYIHVQGPPEFDTFCSLWYTKCFRNHAIWVFTHISTDFGISYWTYLQLNAMWCMACVRACTSRKEYLLVFFFNFSNWMCSHDRQTSS